MLHRLFWLGFLTLVPLSLAQAAPADSETLAQAWTLLIVFVLLALGMSFLCSVAETVLLSVTPAYIENLRASHPRRAQALQTLRQDKVDRSLAAILTMNTIAHTVGAIESGAQSAVVFGSNWVGLFSAVMTLLILFFSEIIPKTLGAVFWPKLVTPTLWYIRGLIVMMYPLVKTSELITQLITRNREVPKFNRDEFIALAGLGEKSGEIDPQELRIIHNLFHFRSLVAKDIMTPRTVITALSETLTMREAIAIASKLPFSRIPLYKESVDDATSFVLKNEILMHTAEGQQNLLLRSIRRQINCVPDCMSLPVLLEFLLNQRQHIAMVVDEYGAIQGLVTLEDVIETLLGMEIIDEVDNIVDMRQWARNRWEQRARHMGMPESTEPEQNSSAPNPTAQNKSSSDITD